MAMVGGPIREIKIPVQELWLKTLGGLIRERGRICGTLRYNNRMNEGVIDNRANKSCNSENSINMPNSVQLTKLHLKALSNFYKICLSLQNTDKLMK